MSCNRVFSRAAPTSQVLCDGVCSSDACRDALIPGLLSWGTWEAKGTVARPDFPHSRTSLPAPESPHRTSHRSEGRENNTEACGGLECGGLENRT